MVNRRGLNILCMLLLLINIMCVSVSVSAQGETYEIPEMSMSFELPSYLNVISKGIKQNDVLFTSGDFDYIQTMSVIRDNNDYYLIYDKDKTFTIEVKISDTEFGFDNMSKASDKKLQSSIEALQRNSGVISADVYDSGLYKFIDVSESTNEGSNTVFTEKLITTYNKQDLSIIISSINDKPTETEHNLIKGMADSVKFPEESVLDLSVLSPTLIGAFILLMVGFAAVVFIRLKNIPVPFLEFEKSPAKQPKIQKTDEIPAEEKVTANTDTDKTEDAPKQDSKEPEEETPVSFSEEELAAAIANFTDRSSK